MKKTSDIGNKSQAERLKDILKSFFCNIQEEPGGVSNLKFELVGCSGKDLATIIFGCVNLGAKMGLFDKEREEISE